MASKAGGRAKHVIVSLRQGVPRPHAGLAAGRRHPGAEGMDRQPRSGLRADSVPRWLPHAGHLVRTVSSAACANSGIEPQNVAGVILETYQGGSAAFAPPEYMQALRQWCTGHKALLVCDEVQAGFGRTGTHVGLRALRHRARSGDLRQGHFEFAAAGGGGRPTRRHGPASRGQHDLHAHRQSGLLRGGAGLHRSGGQGKPGRQRARAWARILHKKLRALQSRFPQIGAWMARVWWRAWPASSRARRSPTATWPGTWSTLRGERRADVHAGGFGGGDGQDRAAAGDQRSGACWRASPCWKKPSRRRSPARRWRPDARPQVLIVGGGMITHDQLLPSLYHLQRKGRVGEICRLRVAWPRLARAGRAPTLAPRLSRPDPSTATRRHRRDRAAAGSVSRSSSRACRRGRSWSWRCPISCIST